MYHVPNADINLFSKWTSNDAKVSSLSKTTGKLKKSWKSSRYSYKLTISKKHKSVTLKPTKSNSSAKLYMCYKGGSYKEVSSLKVSLKRGQTKAVYIRCVSQTGTKYTKTYKIAIKRSK